MGNYPRPLTTVRSYPDRGPWGNNKHRGNCSGWLLVDLLRFYDPIAVLDPSEGGGTTRDVCLNRWWNEVDVLAYLRSFEFTSDGRRIRAPHSLPWYMGYDLANGPDENLYMSPWGDTRFDLVFWHPPYGSMIAYSDGEMCDTLEQANGDLSRLRYREFRHEVVEAALHLLYNAVAPGGFLVILIGTYRMGGIERHFDLDLIDGLGVPTHRWVKLQHNYSSMGFRYPNVNFAYTTHEHVLHWRRPDDPQWTPQRIIRQFDEDAGPLPPKTRYGGRRAAPTVLVRRGGRRP